jgi:hypothetical protein
VPPEHAQRGREHDSVENDSDQKLAVVRGRDHMQQVIEQKLAQREQVQESGAGVMEPHARVVPGQ